MRQKAENGNEKDLQRNETGLGAGANAERDRIHRASQHIFAAPRPAPALVLAECWISLGRELLRSLRFRWRLVCRDFGRIRSRFHGFRRNQERPLAATAYVRFSIRLFPTQCKEKAMYVVRQESSQLRKSLLAVALGLGTTIMSSQALAGCGGWSPPAAPISPFGRDLPATGQGGLVSAVFRAG